MSLFKDKVAKLLTDHEAFLSQKNEPLAVDNGVVTRYKNQCSQQSTPRILAI